MILPLSATFRNGFSGRRAQRAYGMSFKTGGEQLCVTSAWPDEELSGVEVPFQIDYGRLPCRLPFLTGDLVKLDGPVFDEPVYGVWCDEP